MKVFQEVHADLKIPLTNFYTNAVSGVSDKYQVCLDSVAKVGKGANDCKTPCTSVFADVLRADDTKLITDKMELSNLTHDLANEGAGLHSCKH